MDLVVTVYQKTESFPREERFGLTSQIRRAAVSIPANIAEGAARQSDKEFAYFLSNAQGSTSELETEFLIGRRLGYFSEDVYIELRAPLESIGRMIGGLSQHIRRKQARDK